MLKIAICDDYQLDQDRLVECFHELSSFQISDCSIHHFFSGEELCQFGTSKFDLIFLDVVMEGFDGIETMNRFISTNTLIIFMSTTNDRLREMFSPNVIGFLDKPIALDQLHMLWNKALSRINAQKQHVFSYKKNSAVCVIPCIDILYLESAGHYIHIHTIREVITYKGRIRDVWNSLKDNETFCMPNRSYVVNLHYLSLKTKNTLTVSNDEISIGRTNRQDTIARILTFASKKGGYSLD